MVQHAGIEKEICPATARDGGLSLFASGGQYGGKGTKDVLKIRASLSKV